MIFARRLIAAWLVSGTMFPNGTHRRSNNASPRGKWRYCSTPLFFRPRSRWRWPVARQDCFLFHQSVLSVLEITREREKNNELANFFVSTILKILKFRAKLTKYLESNRYLYYEKIRKKIRICIVFRCKEFLCN